MHATTPFAIGWATGKFRHLSLCTGPQLCLHFSSSRTSLDGSEYSAVTPPIHSSPCWGSRLLNAAEIPCYVDTPCRLLLVTSAPATVMNHICGSYNCGWVVSLVSFAFRRDFTVHYGHHFDALHCQLGISGLSDFLYSIFFGTVASSFSCRGPVFWILCR